MCLPHQVWLLKNECCGRGVPTNVTHAECMQMCTAGIRIQSLIIKDRKQCFKTDVHSALWTVVVWRYSKVWKPTRVNYFDFIVLFTSIALHPCIRIPCNMKGWAKPHYLIRKATKGLLEGCNKVMSFSHCSNH